MVHQWSELTWEYVPTPFDCHLLTLDRGQPYLIFCTSINSKTEIVWKRLLKDTLLEIEVKLSGSNIVYACNIKPYENGIIN